MVAKRIAVVGGGVIGLSCAVRLLEETPNVRVTIISEEFSPNTTGDGSAGWIRPYLPGNTPVELIRYSIIPRIHYIMYGVSKLMNKIVLLQKNVRN